MSWQILQGNVLQRLAQIPDDSVHCVITSPPYWGLRSYLPEGHPDKQLEIGMESDPVEYLAKLVAIFRGVRRVLHPTGTLWVNMGDCYATGAGKVGRAPGGGKQGQGWIERGGSQTQPNRMPIHGLKPKDLVGMPWRLALALQSDGWWLRMDIIWNKPCPMPESVRDRPTRSHEYVFLLSKSEAYFYDSFAVMEPTTGNAHSRGSGRKVGKNSRMYISRDTRHSKAPQNRYNESFSAAVRSLVDRRNIRSVWTIAARGFKGAHFATFPERLVETPILAGTSAHGCCSFCSAPWIRIVERPRSGDWHPDQEMKSCGINRNLQNDRTLPGPKSIGWRPGCDCSLSSIEPCTVLDIFCGSGSTGVVAVRHGRNFIGIELNSEYVQMADRRISDSLSSAQTEVA